MQECTILGMFIVNTQYDALIINTIPTNNRSPALSTPLLLVRLVVIDEMVFPAEAGSAKFAVVRLLARVRQFVEVQRARPAELSAADGALEPLDAHMDTHVLDAITGRFERLSALCVIALVGPLAGVHAHVHPQVAYLVGRVPAAGAQVLLLVVHPHVQIQVLGCFAALSAGWTDAGVRLHVHARYVPFQSRRELERLWALFALISAHRVRFRGMHAAR